MCEMFQKVHVNDAESKAYVYNCFRKINTRKNNLPQFLVHNQCIEHNNNYKVSSGCKVKRIVEENTKETN